MELVESILENWAMAGRFLAIAIGLALVILSLWKKKLIIWWLQIILLAVGVTLFIPAISFLWKLFSIWMAATH